MALAGAVTAVAAFMPGPSLAAVPVAMEGTLEVLVEDHAHTSRTTHLLKTDRGRFELRFARGKAPALTHGTRVRARGHLEGQVLALDESGASSLTVTSAAALPNTAGEQRVAVLLVNFQDDTSQPYTLAQANDVVFSQAGSFMRENSFQSAWLTGNAIGWMTLPIARTCATSTIADAAKQAASAAGLNLALYSRFVYVFPRNDACGWSGVGTVGGLPSDAWINGRLELKVVAHELGHNFGLQHSHANDCDPSPLGPNCTAYDYGDVADVMGASTASHFNAFQKERLGWLNGGGQPQILTAANSGTFQIGAYSSPQTGAKALKVPRGIDPLTGAKRWYYVEYRQPIGFDAGLAGLYQTNLFQGVLIRSAIEGDRNSSYLLDMTPNTVPTFDMTDAALLPGQSFVDSQAGLTITLTARDASLATVQVSLTAPAATCVRANPTLAVLGGATAVAAGATLGYSVNVTNNDSAGCGASSFNLQTTVPGGWSASPANTALTLMAGASAGTALSVTSAAGTASGSYAVATRAQNGASSAHQATASSSYTVAGTALATAVTTNKAVYRRNDSVAMSASVSTNGAPVANASVAFLLVKPNGATVTVYGTTNASGAAAASYRLARKDPQGEWQLHNNASYQGASASASGRFAVQ
jgi:Gametolysin peptidase M11/NPCBM-associated, NEW3 domain of alpha-galactosidase